MATRAVFLGLTPVSLSISMALRGSPKRVECLGYDPRRGIARRAQKAGQIDRLLRQADRALDQADIVFLAVACQHVEPYLNMLAANSAPGTVVFDLTPVKSHALQLAQRILPSEIHFIGLLPALNPATVQCQELSADQASPELLQQGSLGIIPSPATPAEVIDLALHLCQLLGAAPFFLEAAEADSVQAAIAGLPALLSDAMLRACMVSPTWREIQRLAGETWFASVSLAAGEPSATADLIDHNRDHLLVRLQALQQQLTQWQAMLKSGSRQELEQHLQGSAQALSSWLADRTAAEWGAAEGERQPLPRRGLRDTLLGGWRGDRSSR